MRVTNAKICKFINMGNIFSLATINCVFGLLSYMFVTMDRQEQILKSFVIAFLLFIISRKSDISDYARKKSILWLYLPIYSE